MAMQDPSSGGTEGKGATTPSVVDAPAHIARMFRDGRFIEGVHYGRAYSDQQRLVLLKPGAELILATFGLFVDPTVTTERTANQFVYQCRSRAVRLDTNMAVAVGMGEASTAEDRLCWRAANKPEYEHAANHARRVVYPGNGEDPELQVRTNHADVGNTAIKLAKKRALVDLAMSLGASAVFTQDLDVLTQPERTAAPTRPTHISEAKLGLIRKLLKQSGWTEKALCAALGVASLAEIRYDDAPAAIAKAQQQQGPASKRRA